MTKHETRIEADAEVAAPEVAAPRSTASKLRRYALMFIVPLLLLAGVVAYYVLTDHIVSTDNAYVQQDKVSVSSQVTGEIVEVNVGENQRVNKGDLLFRIDPEPFRIAIRQADADIAKAERDVTELRTGLATTGVDIAGAREDVAFYTEEYKRQAELMQRGFTTRARLQEAEHDLSDARSRLASAQAAAERARASLSSGRTVPGQNPEILQAQALKASAQLDLSRTDVFAPASGIVSQADRLQVGQMLTTGLPALSIVMSGRSWVEANFKETDLVRMKVGQPATLHFDAYPDMKLTGHVASIGAGTGSEFAIIPAQNASGNWVKVTQRVPVRIAIDEKPSRPLIAGLSVSVDVDTSK